MDLFDADGDEIEWRTGHLRGSAAAASQGPARPATLDLETQVARQRDRIEDLVANNNAHTDEIARCTLMWARPAGACGYTVEPAPQPARGAQFFARKMIAHANSFR